MTQLFHLTGGTLQSAGGPRIICHCLLLKHDDTLVLVDNGIGLLDVLYPKQRIGAEAVERFGFRLDKEATAYQQLKKRGLEPRQVKHCILTHLDTDHTGGLADFPWCTVHLSKRELDSFRAGNPRYAPAQLAHQPRLQAYDTFTQDWFGFRATPLEVGLKSQVLLVELPGHTLGHCGVAVEQAEGWLLHAGDAYYLREELWVDNHPVSEVSRRSAMDAAAQVSTAGQLKKLIQEQAGKVQVISYHDPTEFQEM